MKTPQEYADHHLETIAQIGSILNGYDMQTFSSAHSTIKSINETISRRLKELKSTTK